MKPGHHVKCRGTEYQDNYAHLGEPQVVSINFVLSGLPWPNKDFCCPKIGNRIPL